jgi:hypothetical protein
MSAGGGNIKRDASSPRCAPRHRARGRIEPETSVSALPKESAMTALVIVLTLQGIIYAYNAYQVMSIAATP